MNNGNTKEDRLTLELLNAIEQDSDLSQRRLASHMGVALGLANSYLKRCVRKGLVKIHDAPANRYLYYLTPKGFSEKARLTAQYLSSSLVFYREAAESCTAIYAYCQQSHWHRLLLCGLSDLAEIAILRANNSPVEIIGIYDRDCGKEQFFSKPVWREFCESEPFDACVLTDLKSPLTTYESLVGAVGAERLLVPEVLGLKGIVGDNGR